VFRKPANEDWRVEANWEDAYFGAAYIIIKGVVAGRYQRAVEGVAGLFMFRHYLELAMKYIVLHSRWLKDGTTRADREEIEELKNTHSLKRLWHLVRTEALPKVEADWENWDIDFVEECVNDFAAIDPGHGVRFRYQRKKFGGPIEHGGYEHLQVDFAALLENMPHVQDVLEIIDLWFYETHGQIEDYESDMAAWGGWSDVGY
jgi:hypothetical protein